MQTELLSSGNDRIRFPVNKLMENFKKKLLKQCNLHKVLMSIHPLNAQRSENTQVRYTRVGTWKKSFSSIWKDRKGRGKKSNSVEWKNRAFQELVEKENCRVCDKLRRQTAAEKIPHLLRPKRNYLFIKTTSNTIFVHLIFQTKIDALRKSWCPGQYFLFWSLFNKAMFFQSILLYLIKVSYWESSQFWVGNKQISINPKIEMFWT